MLDRDVVSIDPAAGCKSPALFISAITKQLLLFMQLYFRLHFYKSIDNLTVSAHALSKRGRG